MKGGPRKPIEILKAQGTYNVTRMRERGESIQPTISVDTSPPEGLNEWGDKMWCQIIAEYQKLGLVTILDLGSLFTLCSEYGVYCEACDMVQAQGLQVYDDKGNLGINPARKIANDALKNYIKLATEFGLTPASRTRIAKPESKPDNPFGEFM